jgi:hypothetical protein
MPDAPPVPAPVNDVAAPPPASAVASMPAPGQPLPDAFPPPGQPPYIPPVVNADGTQGYGQGGFLRDVWHQFHNGVPSDLLFGPAPPQPGDPAAPPLPGEPLPPPP